MITKRKTLLGHKEYPPDIFKAAEDNDVEELVRALEDGQSLSQQDHMRLKMTPLHVAAAKQSNDFLAVASQHESFNPWIRDANLRVPFDHARAFNNKDGMKIFFDTMYEDLDKPPGKVVDLPDSNPPELG